MGSLVAPEKSNFEVTMKNFILTQTWQNENLKNQSIHNNELIRQVVIEVDTMATHNKMFETKIP